MARDNLLYEIYARRLASQVPPERVPAHVGVILDGNRRWARAMGFVASQGHQRGAAKIADFLTWARDAGVRVVTLWLLSTDNLDRDPAELAPLLDIIATAVEGLAAQGCWCLRLVGVNIAVGYGGRHEIADAVRAILRERAQEGDTLEAVAASLTEEDISAHLYTRGQPDPDLVIRTSGEQRLSGFMLWQSVHSEFYFCDVNWPAFRRVDFLRALRDYAGRERRLGR